MSLKLSKGYEDAYLTLAQILREKKNYREACELLERVELKSSRSNWSFMLARLYEEWGDERLAAGEKETALTLYRQGLRFLPEDASLLAKSAAQGCSK